MEGNTVVQGQDRVRGPGEHRRPVAFDVADEDRKGLHQILQPPKDLVLGQQRFHHHEAQEV